VKNRKMLLSSLLPVALVFGLILATSVVAASATVPVPDDHVIRHLGVGNFRSASAAALNTPQGQVKPMVAAGWGHTVGLKDGGTVFAVGDNRYGQCDIGGWMDITQIAAGNHHTVGVAG
jgi:alpha-tubulin suppressor-like RCC1 family protein